MCFLIGQARTPKFARQVLLDRTESGLIFSNILPTKYRLSILIRWTDGHKFGVKISLTKQINNFFFACIYKLFFVAPTDKTIPVSIALDEHVEDMHRGGVEDLKNFHIDHHSMLRANLNKKLGSAKKTYCSIKGPKSTQFEILETKQNFQKTYNFTRSVCM